MDNKVEATTGAKRGFTYKQQKPADVLGGKNNRKPYCLLVSP
ncbi:MAG: hypothetical protein NW218_08700 [Saprospiraceae bacterium]|nr:hypothetical protein [Saprospiraceae bacterium]